LSLHAFGLLHYVNANGLAWLRKSPLYTVAGARAVLDQAGQLPFLLSQHPVARQQAVTSLLIPQQFPVKVLITASSLHPAAERPVATAGSIHSTDAAAFSAAFHCDSLQPVPSLARRDVSAPRIKAAFLNNSHPPVREAPGAPSAAASNYAVLPPGLSALLDPPPPAPQADMRRALPQHDLVAASEPPSAARLPSLSLLPYAPCSTVAATFHEAAVGFEACAASAMASTWLQQSNATSMGFGPLLPAFGEACNDFATAALPTLVVNLELWGMDISMDFLTLGR